MPLHKSALLLIALMTANVSAWSIDHYREGDTLFVWAKSGLNLRVEASNNGEKMLTIPYGSYLISKGSKTFLEKGDKEEAVLFCTNFESKKKSAISLPGQWVEVVYNGNRGYLFDLYLSHHPAPELLKREGSIKMESLERYLLRVFGLNKKLTSKEYKNTIVREIYYNRGYSVINWGHKCAESTYVLPNISLSEILIAISNGLFYNDQNLVQIEKEEVKKDNTYLTLELSIDSSHEPVLNLRIEVLGGVIVMKTEECC